MATPIKDKSRFATQATACASTSNAATAARGNADNTAVNPSAKNAARDMPPPLAEKPEGLPSGKYKPVGWDIDTTGKKLSDEIFQIAAYAYPDFKYSQYIMPFRDLKPETSRRHNVHIFIGGRCRMLKENDKNRVVKTKSEVAALTDFIDWLEAIRSKDEMITLMYHDDDGRRLKPKVLIQSLHRYHLLDRFKTVVAGFTDSYALCVEKCKGTIKSMALEVLSQLLLEEDVLTDTASDRAIATYKVIEQLANEKGHYPDEVVILPSKDMIRLTSEFARPVSTEVKALEYLKDFLKLYN